MSREFVARWQSVGADKVARDFTKVASGAKGADRALSGVNDTSARTSRRLEEASLGLKDLAKGFLAFQGVTFLKDAIIQAGDFETGLVSLNKVVGETVASEVTGWAEENADALNLSQSAALDAANAFSVYATAIAEAGGDATDFTTDMTTLAAELASLKGANPDEVITALGAALRGEFDPLERFGIALKASDVSARALSDGLASTEQELTAGDKALATYNLLLERGAFAMGATEAAAGTFSGTMADLRQKVSDLTLELGQALLPAAQVAATALGGLVSGFSGLADPIQTALLALGGFAVVNRVFGSQIAGIGASLKDAGQSFLTFADTMTGANRQYAAFQAGRERLSADLQAGIISQKQFNAEAVRMGDAFLVADERSRRFAGGVGKLRAGFSGLGAAARGVLSIFGGPWVVGITAIVTGLVAASQASAQYKRAVESLTDSMADLSEAARAKSIADFFESQALSIPTRMFTDLDDLNDALRETGLSYRDIENAVYDMTEAEYAALQASLERKALEADSTQKKDAFLATAAAIDDLRMAEETRLGVLDEIASSADGASAATADYAKTLEEVTAEAEESRKALDGLIDSFTVLNGTLNARDSLYEYKEDLRSLSDALASGELTFSPDSEAGKENWDALVTAAETADNRIRAVLSEEGPQAAAAAWDAARQEISQALTDAGVDAQVASGLLNQIFGKEYTIDASFNEISTVDAETSIAEAIARLQGKVLEIEQTEATISADVRIPQPAKNVMIADLEAEQASIQVRIGNRQEILNELKGLTPQQKVQVGAELLNNGGNVKAAIAAITGKDWSTDIDVGAKNLKSAENAISNVADGPYKADIKVDDVGTSVAARAIDEAAKDRYSTIWVTTRRTGGGGGGGDDDETRSSDSGFERLAAMAAGMESYVRTSYPAQPFFKGGGSPVATRVSTPEKVEIKPRRERVAVYLDGAEIASHLDLKADRLVAAAAGRRA